MIDCSGPKLDHLTFDFLGDEESGIAGSFVSGDNYFIPGCDMLSIHGVKE